MQGAALQMSANGLVVAIGMALSQGVGLGPILGVCVGATGVGVDVEVGVGDAVNVGVGGTALSAAPAPGVCIIITLPGTTG